MVSIVLDEIGGRFPVGNEMISLNSYSRIHIRNLKLGHPQNRFYLVLMKKHGFRKEIVHLHSILEWPVFQDGSDYENLYFKVIGYQAGQICFELELN